MSSPKLRFAPAPTGLMHLGNVRAALLNFLCARHLGGEFWVRFDDTDRARSQEEFQAQIIEDLAWLGLGADGCVRQSERMTIYAPVIEKLKASGRLYPCFETPEELEVKRQRQREAGHPPRYDRAALQLSDNVRSAYLAEGRPHHWRFRLDDQAVAWDDLMRGSLTQNAQTLSDPVVVRADGTVGFLLAGAIDDMEMGMTHVIRGEDHLANTAIQIQIMEALGTDRLPQFGHFSYMRDAGGGALSKRSGSLSVQTLRENGMYPLAVAAYIGALGTSDSVPFVETIKDLWQTFDLSRYSNAMSTFNLEDLERINQMYLHQLTYKTVQPFLKEHGVGDISPSLWAVVQTALTRVWDIKHWKQVCAGTIQPVAINLPEAVVQSAQGLLPTDTRGTDAWQCWTQAILAAHPDLKRGALFKGLRLLITGQAAGPEMAKLFPLIQRSCILERLDVKQAIESH
jgi:glutamyl-tRNA synthetase